MSQNKIITVLLTISMLFSLVGCNSNGGIEEKPIPIEEQKIAEIEGDVELEIKDK